VRTVRGAAGAESIPIAFETTTLFAAPGQSLAAALAAGGILALRRTAAGTERGVFCGMGVCQECLVVVDGVPNQRACSLKITAPVTVTRQTATTEPADRGTLPPVALDDLEPETPQVLVIGGGAGGLSAALAARRADAEVVLLDERTTAGGQYFKQAGGGPGARPLDRQQAEGGALVQAVARSGAVVAADKRACMVDLARLLTRFCADEACGKTIPCRIGLRRVSEIGDRVATGLPKPTDVQLLADLSADIVGSALCDHERLATLPFASGMRYFRSELDEHILRSSCPAGVCHPIALASAGASH